MRRTAINILPLLLSFQVFSQLDTLEMHYYHSEYKYVTHIDLSRGHPIEKYVYTEGPNKGQEIDSITATKINVFERNPDIRDCSPCWLRTFDQNGLNYEGEFYLDCCVGIFVRYHPNGLVSERGQYFSLEEINKNQDVECLPKGIWKYYDEQGNLILEINSTTHTKE
jgi:hypothetical protein